jgi:thiol-disulfide isomerase/thioredoxin
MRDPSAARTRARGVLASGLACVALGLGLAACGGGDEGGSGAAPPDYNAALKGAPAKLAALYAEGGKLVDGGTDAFGTQLDELRGYPVVVNKWASWCGPCRAEFPYFQKEVADRGKQVAFVGVNSNDSEDAAKTFLGEFPIPYPSYSDPGQDISDEYLRGESAFPTTAFYDSKGELAYVHIGQYASRADLTADIKRYAQ